MKIFIAILSALIVGCFIVVLVSPAKRTAPLSLVMQFDLNQFQKSCPPTTGLTFATQHPGGAGIIMGTQNGVNFSSLYPNEPAPQKLSGNIIQDVQPYNRNGMYGAQTGNRMSCYYQYINSLNNTVYLVLVGLITN